MTRRGRKGKIGMKEEKVFLGKQGGEERKEGVKYRTTDPLFSPINRVRIASNQNKPLQAREYR